MEGLWFANYFRELNMQSIILRLVICTICGGAVGIEREWRHRTAGFKTHILVCLGAAVCMMTGQYVREYMKISGVDPTRIGAQVISGIGFLGVGTIIVTKNAKVKGLTTAAGLWVSACIGLAVGIGFYEIAILSTILVVALFLGVRQLNMFDVVRENNMHVYIELRDVTYVRVIMNLFRENKYSVYSMSMKESKMEDCSMVGVVFGIRGGEQIEREILSLISQQEYVLGYVELEN